MSMSPTSTLDFQAAAHAFRPPWWLPEGHAQTLWAKAIQPPLPAYRRELWPDSTGQTQVAYDFIDSADPQAPLVVLFHGLEGSSHSHYARALMNTVQAQGLNGVVAHFRGCGGVSNDSDRAYHSGDSTELAWMLTQLQQRHARIWAVGVSLGGNVLAKYLGEQGPHALCEAAAVISAPLDLPAASSALERGLSLRLYAPYFLRTLLPKINTQTARIDPNRFDRQRVLASKSLLAFDDAFTAPVHGFADAITYYRQCSAKPLLRHIAKPTLIVNAQNDPFLPAYSLPAAADVSPQVHLLQPHHGGHVGFVSGRFPGHLNWLPTTLLAFFIQQAARPNPFQAA